MGRAAPSGPVKVIAGFIFNDQAVFEKAASFLAKKLGPVDSEAGPFLFNHTEYYNDETGKGLKRRFLSFRNLRNPEEIYKLKGFTNGLEKRFSVGGKRRINIDPGYLTLSKLVLFTTKDYFHRMYLKNGIYAEVTLFFKNGSYQPLEWTYPDYKTKDYLDYFNRLRCRYLEELKNLR